MELPWEVGKAHPRDPVLVDSEISGICQGRLCRGCGCGWFGAKVPTEGTRSSGSLIMYKVLVLPARAALSLHHRHVVEMACASSMCLEGDRGDARS